MKEITAVIRAKRMNATKQALHEAGFGSMTAQMVKGRGKQLGLIGEYSHPVPAADPEHLPPPSFVAKRMITLLVKAEDVVRVVETITNTNRTGSPGDGKIFVAPIKRVQRVRTAERGVEAL